MAKKQPTPRLSSFLQDIYGMYNEIDTKAGEATEWADKHFFGKQYEEVFSEFLENNDYEIMDQGKVQNGSFKKVIQYRSSPLVQIVVYHDKKGLINTTLIETNH